MYVSPDRARPTSPKVYSSILSMAAPSPFDNVEFPLLSSLPFLKGDPEGTSLFFLSYNLPNIPILYRSNMGILRAHFQLILQGRTGRAQPPHSCPYLAGIAKGDQAWYIVHSELGASQAVPCGIQTARLGP